MKILKLPFLVMTISFFVFSLNAADASDSNWPAWLAKPFVAVTAPVVDGAEVVWDTRYRYLYPCLAGAAVCGAVAYGMRDRQDIKGLREARGVDVKPGYSGAVREVAGVEAELVRRLVKDPDILMFQGPKHFCASVGSGAAVAVVGNVVGGRYELQNIMAAMEARVGKQKVAVDDQSAAVGRQQEVVGALAVGVDAHEKEVAGLEGGAADLVRAAADLYRGVRDDSTDLHRDLGALGAQASAAGDSATRARRGVFSLVGKFGFQNSSLRELRAAADGLGAADLAEGVAAVREDLSVTGEAIGDIPVLNSDGLKVFDRRLGDLEASIKALEDKEGSGGAGSGGTK